MLGLRGRLIYAFLGITLVPLSLLVAVNHWTVSRILTDNARRSLASSARLTADQIDRLIDENLTTVRVEAILPDVIRYIESPSPEHYPAAIQTLLSLARRDSINVLSYGLIQRSGTNVLDTYTPFIGRQEGEKPVFVQAIRTGLPYVDALRRAERRERGLGEISFSAPVRNATGDVIGVLRVTYNATVVAQVIQRQTGTAGEASFAMLLDNNGIRLAHGLSPDWHYQPLLPLTEDQRFQLSQQYPNLGDATPSTDPALQAAIQERETTTLITRLPELGSQKALVSLAPLRNIPWLVMVVQPEAVFLAPIRQQTQRYLALGVGSAAVVVILAIWGGQLLATPVVTLTQLLSRFHSSQRASPQVLQEKLIQPLQAYAQQLQTPAQAWQGFAELGILTQAFVRLAEELQGSLTELTHVNAVLEERVQARTAELEQANQAIAALNKQLRDENRRLSAELEVTRRLQQMILPRPEELSGIPDLEIVAYMEPAAEVGGDYYDVLLTEDRVRIGIGDVTGHGLESGMVMLMVQMAVRTLLSQGERDLRRFLQILNHALYANVHRMNTDKNLTLTLLDYCHGKVSIVGQHEELLWLRHTGELRRIDTLDLGFPVGLEPDISPWINEVVLELERGDMLILYTDGIIEARGTDHKLYGLERLCQVIRAQGHGSAAELQAAIIRDVHAHIGQGTIDDDLTLLVVRRRV